MIPSVQFLELLVNNPEKIFDEYILREQNKRKGFKPVSSFFKANDNINNNDDLSIDNDDNLEREIVDFKKNKNIKKSLKIKKENKLIKEDSCENEFYL
jgi:hypothetical protein